MRRRSTLLIMMMITASTLFAQAPKSKYLAWVELKDELGLIPGDLMRITDTTMFVYSRSIGTQIFSPDLGAQTIHYSRIERIKTRHRKSILKGFLIGSAAGMATGFLVGYALGDDEPGMPPENAWLGFDFTYSASQKGLIGMVPGLLVGGISGIIIGGTAKKKHEIFGNRKRFDRFRDKYDPKLIEARKTGNLQN